MGLGCTDEHKQWIPKQYRVSSTPFRKFTRRESYSLAGKKECKLGAVLQTSGFVHLVSTNCLSVTVMRDQYPASTNQNTGKLTQSLKYCNAFHLYLFICNYCVANVSLMRANE